MEAETLLPLEGRPSVEVDPRKGRPCGAGMAAEMGGIGAWLRLVVFDSTRTKDCVSNNGPNYIALLMTDTLVERNLCVSIRVFSYISFSFSSTKLASVCSRANALSCQVVSDETVN